MITEAKTESLIELVRDLQGRCERDCRSFNLLAAHAHHPGVVELMLWCARQRSAFVDELRDAHMRRSRFDDLLEEDVPLCDDEQLDPVLASVADPVEAARRIEVSASIAYRAVLTREMPEGIRLLLMSHLYVIDRTRHILARVQEGEVIVDAAGSVWTRSLRSQVA